MAVSEKSVARRMFFSRITPDSLRALACVTNSQALCRSVRVGTFRGNHTCLLNARNGSRDRLASERANEGETSASDCVPVRHASAHSLGEFARTSGPQWIVSRVRSDSTSMPVLGIAARNLDRTTRNSLRSCCVRADGVTPCILESCPRPALACTVPQWPSICILLTQRSEPDRLQRSAWFIDRFHLKESGHETR